MALFDENGNDVDSLSVDRNVGGNFSRGVNDALNTVKNATNGLINGSARDTQAELYRQQFADYISRFGPKEEELVAAYGNEGMRENQINKAVGYANQGMDNAEQAQAIQQSRFQTALTPQEQEAQRRTFALQRGLATADIANRTRQHIMDRDKDMLTGGLSGYAKKQEA